MKFLIEFLACAEAFGSIVRIMFILHIPPPLIINKIRNLFGIP